ncbi:guanyl-specific ribonuclease F1 [Stipitochalara longipes BDJ]|nr:guanyl-specific ribonuclease F1 [Stipitochalara longipes BDJ]
MKLNSIVLLFVVSVAAQSISDEPSSSNCDGTTYSQQNIDDAATAALSYYASGQTVGKDSYPHQYNDYEGFSFTCSAPYLEFPIKTSGVYSGGSPGADRVVIGSISSDESTAEYCAVITHDGQSGNDFGECSDS